MELIDTWNLHNARIITLLCVLSKLSPLEFGKYMYNTEVMKKTYYPKRKTAFIFFHQKFDRSRVLSLEISQDIIMYLLIFFVKNILTSRRISNVSS